ncbi:acyl-CoA desaturase [Mariniphaga sediminis]|uniref:Acyl-CoA desaturase n=1 Tax=Mariniphaga sediminis TaxID=1628158 RepID=A0A399D1D2_9BACT|nr:acyl-CoA desaturase [Mariniphaga sediminis]RIH64491.1 acyl-CoA desaturase [Mariniphaga sediminis]
MENIKYSKNQLDFTTELRNSVNEYFSKNNIQPYGNRKIYVKTIFMLLLYLTPFILMISGLISSVLPLLACWFIMGLGMSGLGMATMHDANHGSFSKSQKVNRFFGNSLYLLGGFPPNWRYQHNTLHHGFTNIEGHDEDIAPPGVLRFSPHRPLKKIHRYQHIYAWFFYSLMTISWIVTKDFKRLKKYEEMGAKLSGKRKFNRLLVDVVISKVLYYSVFLIIPLLTIPVSWYWVIGGFLLMHFTSGLVLSAIFQTAHVVPTSEYPVPDEEGELKNNWTIHQLYTTCDYSPKSRIFSWLVGGLNYQVEHHLFPYISHIHYRDISKIVQVKAREYGLPYHVNKNFATAVWQHIKMLKLLGKKQIIINTSFSAAKGNKAMAV